MCLHTYLLSLAFHFYGYKMTELKNFNKYVTKYLAYILDHRIFFKVFFFPENNSFGLAL